MPLPCLHLPTSMCILFYTQGRTQGVGFGVNPPLSLIFYKNFITCTKEIKCFRILFAC